MSNLSKAGRISAELMQFRGGEVSAVIDALRAEIAERDAKIEQKNSSIKSWRTSAEQAISNIKSTNNENARIRKERDALSALITSMEVQEPVATVNIWQYKGLTNHDLDYFGDLPKGTHALYQKPLSRKPLTEGQIARALAAWFAPQYECNSSMEKRMRAAIEAAEGIEGGEA